MSTPVFVPEWVLGDLGLDVSIGDHVDWPVSPLDHAWADRGFHGFASVDLHYEWDSYEVTGTVSGTIVGIQALHLTHAAAGNLKPNGTTAWAIRSTATAWSRGRPSANGFIFEVAPGSPPAPDAPSQ
jgi:hypothetical protein